MPAPYTSPLAAAIAPDLLERFQRYVAIDTQSRRDRERSPSTPGQLDLGRLLVAELHGFGLADAELDGNGYVMATVPGSTDTPLFGVIAHVDTTMDAPGKDVKPLVHRDYDGGVIELPLKGTRLDPATMPLLGTKCGHGVAAIMAAVKYLVEHPELPRPTLRVAFTPDEEIGEGATLFDIPAFGAPRAYTIDGAEIGQLEDESFSAVEMILTITGVDVHPGQATGKMVSALRLAARVVDSLPSDRLTPATTSGREGFIHVFSLTGTPGSAEIRAIVRDFDDQLLADHVALFERTAGEVLETEPRAHLDVHVRPQYPNMRRFIDRDPDVIEAALQALGAEGIKPLRTPIRGGTDGSRLSEMGLPTPNLFTGGHEFHSVREWASVQDMAAASAVIVRLAEVWSRRAA
jgi:tripeptide aminopeptidase